jgi:hypothetical protein
MLDYATPPTPDRPPWSFETWFDRHGPDSFLGCSALFTSLLPWLAALAGFLAFGWRGFGDIACFSVLFAFLGIVQGLGGLVERGVSRTFPTAALALAVLYILAVVGAGRLL